MCHPVERKALAQDLVLTEKDPAQSLSLLAG